MKEIKREARKLGNLTEGARKFIKELDRGYNDMVSKVNSGKTIKFKTVKESMDWMLKNPNTDLIVCVEP